MRKWFLVSATAASMALASAVAPAFADEQAPTSGTTLACTVSSFGRTFNYVVTVDKPLPIIQPITIQRNGVTLTVTPDGSATLQFGLFTAHASCKAA